ncbi:DUF6520 family protein [Zunongwangia sp. HRR-M8]|uniref:DUF6520 family protein n=1 Tax=Zunongwangia sp. HRR-M8 TaxID=3015170 RepID=UPI0022DDC86C|nr:DUF6520 family protein [Zunongwangia sp. HRR-M8]WBL22327.1 DUF6520 family protein [Zunongwangia sp. HRR-M8]
MMRNVKFLLPMLAFICAIGMAFATVDLKPDPEPEMQAMDYILLDGEWEAIPEQNCQGTDDICRVQLGANGPVFEVFDELGDNNAKPSGEGTPQVINL